MHTLPGHILKDSRPLSLPLTGTQDLEERTQKLPEVDLDTVPIMEEPEEDADGLAEYTFPKFAVTYFQKSASHTHIRRPLRYPLLYHEEDADCSVPGSLVSSGSGLPLVQREPGTDGVLWAPRCVELASSQALCPRLPRPPWLCGTSSRGSWVTSRSQCSLPGTPCVVTR